MKTLIVGCGYLGTRVGHLWQSQHHEVQVLTRSVERAIQFDARGWRAMTGDACDSATRGRLPEAEVSLLAVGYDRDGGYSRREIAGALQAVAEQLSNRCGHLIYISSSSVYGQQDGRWVDESSECLPTQPGGQFCLETEEFLGVLAARTGMNVTILRLSGIYGPGRLLSRVQSLRSQIPLSGREEAWLNLIHVDDAARVVVAAADKPASADCYLVSDDCPVRRGDYYRHLAQLVSAPVPVFDPELPVLRGAGGINKRCRNDRVKQAFDLTWKYPSYVEGLAQSLSGS